MTRRPIPALNAALGVFAFLIAKDVLSAIAYFTGWEYVGLTLLASTWSDLCFALGVFLVLWAVFPVTVRSSTAQAIVAGALAAVAGGIVMFLGGLLLAFVIDSSTSQPFDLVARGVFLTIVSLLPLTVLAAVLVREWLRSRAAIDAPKELAEAN